MVLDLEAKVLIDEEMQQLLNQGQFLFQIKRADVLFLQSKFCSLASADYSEIETLNLIIQLLTDITFVGGYNVDLQRLVVD